jgi:murein DD-endopeptidase MepM/ murein hydrolase activator NlpD
VIRTGVDAYVVLGHLRRGTVRVRIGDAVRAGEAVGQAGNSGWTERPHLHMQAMRAPGGDWWHGEPVPMRFGGRFLVKNQVVRSDPAS